MGIYIKGVRAHTIEVDGVKIATSSFAGRLPSYRDYGDMNFRRTWDNKCARLAAVAKKHLKNGVYYVMEGTKKSLVVSKRNVATGYTEHRIPVIKLGIRGDINEHLFDDHRVAEIVVEYGKKPWLEWKDAK